VLAAIRFILKHRLPVGLMRAGWHPWCSTMATNVAILLAVGALIRLVGIGPFLLVHLPVALLAGLDRGLALLVQHQFEDTFWAPTFRRRSWSTAAALATLQPIVGHVGPQPL
jgi:acyl-lipid omega-6 desaturase (Delta-12 desaturase)